jgi:hypothetical protein
MPQFPLNLKVGALFILQMTFEVKAAGDWGTSHHVWNGIFDGESSRLEFPSAYDTVLGYDRVFPYFICIGKTIKHPRGMFVDGVGYELEGVVIADGNKFYTLTVTTEYVYMGGADFMNYPVSWRFYIGDPFSNDILYNLFGKDGGEIRNFKADFTFVEP